MTFQAYKLVSLWEIMEYLAAGKIVRLVQGITLLAICHMDDKNPLPSQIQADLLKDLPELKDECDRLELATASHLIQSEISTLKINPLKWNASIIAKAIMRIIDTIQIELSSRKCFFIKPSMADFYQNPIEKFGEKAVQKFPSITFDVDEAGKCLALNRHTACVFHLMRIFERGIHHIAQYLNITLNENQGWLENLKKICNEIEKLPLNSADDKEKEKYFQQAKSHLHGIRRGWRNDTMHPKQTYTEEEAKELYEHTKAFMRHLAEMI